jgi:hypothetical protein
VVVVVVIVVAVAVVVVVAAVVVVVVGQSQCVEMKSIVKSAQVNICPTHFYSEWPEQRECHFTNAYSLNIEGREKLHTQRICVGL